MINKNSVVLVYIISFVDLFAIGLTFPLLAPHLRNLGASHTLIGALSSVYAGIQVVSGPIVGGWTDLRGRKHILKRVLLICGICYGLLGLTSSFSVIIFIRILLGIVKHIQSICKALITDVLPPERHTEAFGKSAAVSSLGFIIGPLLGGHISDYSNGFRYVCFLTMILFFINIGFTSYLPERKKKEKNNNTFTETNSIVNEIKIEITKTILELKSINWTMHWESFSLRFLFSLVVTTFLANQGLILKEKYMLSQKHSGYVISYFSAVGTFSAFFLDKTKRFFKQNDCLTRLLTFFIIITISTLAIYVTTNMLIYLCILIPFSMSSTALRIISMELILQNSYGEHKGSLSGASNSVMSISRFISPLITGLIGDIFGEEFVVLAAVFPALIAIFLCLHLKTKQTVEQSNRKLHVS